MKSYNKIRNLLKIKTDYLFYINNIYNNYNNFFYHNSYEENMSLYQCLSDLEYKYIIINKINNILIKYYNESDLSIIIKDIYIDKHNLHMLKKYKRINFGYSFDELVINEQFIENKLEIIVSLKKFISTLLHKRKIY